MEAQLTEAQLNQFQNLAAQLRCVVCYNQNLAESQAPLAAEMKRLLQQKIAKGETQTEILASMAAEYGDFILYQPPFQWGTALLWLGPLLLLSVAIWKLRRWVV